MRLSILFLLTLAACSGSDDKDDSGVVDSGDTDTDTDTDTDSGTVEDADGDGVNADEDCDDANAAVFPGNAEVCDELDNDCNGQVDDNASDAGTWYSDADRDGYGADGAGTVSCQQPPDTTAQGGDCNDDDAAYNPGATESDCNDPNDYNCDGSVGFEDGDADGFAACEECDDSDAAEFPGAPEVCDGDDDNCDGAVDEPTAVDAATFFLDADGDGYGDAASTTLACDAPANYVADATDCRDSDAASYPGADETCDSADNDCDSEIDEDAVDALTFYTDADGDGYGDDTSTVLACSAPEGAAAVAGDCDDADTAFNPGVVEDDCSDPTDYNCDGSTGFADDDGDGYAACEECDDLDAAIFPGATEVCDGADNDCDGSVDGSDSADASVFYTDADADGYGDASSSMMSCSAPSGYVADATDCLDSDDASYPGAPETCDDADNDCDGSIDDSALDVTTFYADADADGYGSATSSTAACDLPSGYVTDATDCRDSDASAYPGAVEYCDGIDDDCDGSADDSAVDRGTYYRDADSDGFGTSSSSTLSCSLPSGYATTSTDCNDSAAGTYPGAAEVCGGADEDCDGSTDESGASGESTWYRDADADGYTTTGTLNACTEPSGYSALSGSSDCDDTRSAVNPGAAEVCDDGLDNDCVSDDTCDISGDFSVSTVDVRISGTTSTDNVGGSVASGGDYNGDGYDDLAVGAGGYDNGSTSNTGRVYVFYGPLTGSETLSSADVTITGVATDDYLGESEVAFLPDLDGDGDDELLVGAPRKDTAATDAGGAYLFLGGTTSTTLSSAYASYLGANATDYTGWSLRSVGDVNGGGKDDFMIGAYLRGGTDGGVAGMFYGESLAAGSDYVATGDVVFTGSSTNDNLGYAFDGGDIDGDGYADLFVGAPNNTTSTRTGRVFVKYGSASLGTSYTESGGTSSTAVDAVVTGVSTGDRFGYSVVFLPDYDGDGYGDMAVGADYYGSSDNGAAFVVLGGASRLSGSSSISSAADVTFTPESATTGDFFGRTLADAGDVNGDDLSDLLVGATQNDGGGSGSGAVYLFLGGSASATADDAAVKVAGSAANDAFGSRLGKGGDLDGNGRSDVVFGASAYDPSSVSNAGAAFVIFAGAE